MSGRIRRPAARVGGQSASLVVAAWPDAAEDGRVRFDTAVARLRAIADALGQGSRFHRDLVAAYVYGGLLAGSDVEVVDVALAVDVPAEELPWRVEPGRLRALAELLELDRAPLRWVWRPAAEPVAGPLIVGPVRFWTAEHGTDTAVLDALAQRRLADLPRERLDPDEAAAALARDRDRSLRHLRQVVDQFWERDWRREHKGGGIYPQEHLWRAAQGYLELLDASAG